ncbi:helix-turn-helix transcriptional regulator [Pseudomonas viridiflava]|uniref:helix-turn-helix transcriptional regulator n=1 Tax=Pseudomonas viridiflava TaxID=33069 RepID=UPI001C31423D|nr:AlpA family phage regulatory protein [Pseudomonas viridiflava]QXG42220.1 AlpA family phage regulatory protein [Pseudomonas viridiflava]
MTNTETGGRVLLSLTEVLKKLSISRTSLQRLRDKDSTFPKPIKDGTARTARAYFVQHEVEAWIQRKMDSRHAA